VTAATAEPASTSAAAPHRVADVGNAGPAAPAETFTPLYRALTIRGVLLLGGALIVLAAGLLLGYPELTGLGLAGLAAVLIALVAVGRTPRVAVERLIEPARVTRGSQEGARARVTLRAATRRAVPPMSAYDVAGPGSHPFSVPRLKGDTPFEAEVALPADRRGVVPSGPLLVARDDPFGLAHRTLNTGVTAALYVRPRAIPLPDVTASLARSVDGPQSDTSTEGTLAFNSLREYLPGDELRHVHWRASAHAGKLVVKQHVDTAHAAVAVVLDTAVPLPSAGGADPGAHRDPAAADADQLAKEVTAERFDVAVDCAASVAVLATRQHHPLLLLNPSGESLLPPETRRRGGNGVEDVLDALTMVMPRALPTGAIDPLADTVRRLGGGARGSLAAVISTRDTAGLAEPLRLLAAAYARVLAIRVGDAGNGASRTGRVIWLTVGSVDDLPAALMRARSTS
jgi:uncharacterized protein (DUF58 family)